MGNSNGRAKMANIDDSAMLTREAASLPQISWKALEARRIRWTCWHASSGERTCFLASTMDMN
jgi:hypothetical protein